MKIKRGKPKEIEREKGKENVQSGSVVPDSGARVEPQQRSRSPQCKGRQCAHKKPCPKTTEVVVGYNKTSAKIELKSSEDSKKKIKQTERVRLSQRRLDRQETPQLCGCAVDASGPITL